MLSLRICITPLISSQFSDGGRIFSLQAAHVPVSYYGNTPASFRFECIAIHLCPSRSAGITAAVISLSCVQPCFTMIPGRLWTTSSPTMFHRMGPAFIPVTSPEPVLWPSGTDVKFHSHCFLPLDFAMAVLLVQDLPPCLLSA